MSGDSSNDDSNPTVVTLTTAITPPAEQMATEEQRQPQLVAKDVWHVVNLYHFADLTNLDEIRCQIQAKCKSLQLRGSLWLAPEGFNGTLAAEGSRDPLDDIIHYLEHVILHRQERSSPNTTTTITTTTTNPPLHKTLSTLSLLECKHSIATVPPYPRLLVKLKKELVTMAVPSLVNCQEQRFVGQYVEPHEWNDLITAPNVLLIDVRNDYEVDLGTFQGAINPHTKSFSDFPQWWQTQGRLLLTPSSTTTTATATPSFDRPPPTAVAMFCTGGIRCEKSTHYLLQQSEALMVPLNTPVYHLKGGILKYLETVEEAKSTWSGHCFVFDQRVSVSHGLQPGPHSLCFACRRPFVLPLPRNNNNNSKTNNNNNGMQLQSKNNKQLSSASTSDQENENTENTLSLISLYEPGVSCLHCFYETTEEQKRRFRERHRQKFSFSSSSSSSIKRHAKKSSNQDNGTHPSQQSTNTVVLTTTTCNQQDK